MEIDHAESVSKVLHGAVVARDTLIRQADIALGGAADRLLIALSYHEPAAF